MATVTGDIKRMSVSETLPQDCGPYILLEYIGKGTYGSVYKAQSKDAHKSQTFQREAAIKRIKYAGANDKEKEYAEREVDVMSKCDHVNIVSYFDSFFEEGKDYFCIVMEYCPNGNLQKYIRHQTDLISEKTFIDLFKQIASGVEYLHSKDIIHRDLKLTNMLLGQENTVKIADFGVARVLDLTMFASLSYVGTHRFMSPEMHHRQDYDEKTDIWSLGCSAYEMATRKPAYPTQSIDDLRTKLQTGQQPDLEEIRYCDTIKQLIKTMLNPSSPRRPKASSLATVLYEHHECDSGATMSTLEQYKKHITGGDSGYEAEGSEPRSDRVESRSTGDLHKKLSRIKSDGQLKARSNPVRPRYFSEPPDKFYVDTAASIQAKLVEKLKDAKPVAEIVDIIRNEKDSRKRRRAIKKVVGDETLYKEIRPLIRSLKPLEWELVQGDRGSITTETTSSSTSSSEEGHKSYR